MQSRTTSLVGTESRSESCLIRFFISGLTLTVTTGSVAISHLPAGTCSIVFGRMPGAKIIGTGQTVGTISAPTGVDLARSVFPVDIPGTGKPQVRALGRTVGPERLSGRKETGKSRKAAGKPQVRDFRLPSGFHRSPRFSGFPADPFRGRPEEPRAGTGNVKSVRR